MIFRKVLLYGGLVLFATISTLSASVQPARIVTKYITINSTDNEEIPIGTRWKEIQNDTTLTYYQYLYNNTYFVIHVTNITEHNTVYNISDSVTSRDVSKMELINTNNTKNEEIANNTKYQKIANNTKNEEITNNKEYQKIANNTKNEERANNTKYQKIANNTKTEEITNNKEYQKIPNNTHPTHYEQISNNTYIAIHITNVTEVNNDTEYNMNNKSIDFDLLNIIPLYYKGEIRFFSEDNILFGHCSIIIYINESVKSITMYSAPVYIMNAILIPDKNGTVYKLFNSFFNKEKNILTLNFGQRLLHHTFPDTFILKMAYIRIMYKNRKSFVKSAYQEKPEDQTLDQTGVHIMRIRQLFPCEDKLIINSTFKIAIKHDEKYTILSNIPIKARNKTDNGMMWTDFDKSSLSAQQISVVIITFTTVPNNFSNITLWCRQSARVHLFYAMKVFEEVLPYFKRHYFLELSKLDIVVFGYTQDEVYDLASPRLILLREEDIIYNEALDPAIRRREVAHMIGRTLAFLWCNNAFFWSEEGFTTFFGAYVLNEAYESNHMMNLLVVQTLQDSFRYDTSSKDSPTLNSINTSEVNLSGSRDYAKSFIMWRMLYHMIPDVFWSSVYAERNFNLYPGMTTLDDLWDTMEAVVRKIYPEHKLSNLLRRIMQSWTKKYYPRLNVTLHDRNLILFVNFQSPYLLHLLNDNTETWIPITLTTQSSLNFNKTDDIFWLTTPKLEPFNYKYSILNDSILVDKSEWVILNIQQIGYYRVQYDLQNWQKLIHYLNSEDYDNIHILNRAQIIDDAFHFFLQRQLSYKVFWNLTNFMYRDTNFVTWYPLIKAFEMMTCIFPFGFSFHTVHYSALTQEKIKQRIDGLLSEIGYYEEAIDYTVTTYLRQEAVKWACVLDISECRRTAAIELNTVLANSVETSYLKNEEWIYCYGLTTASYDIWYKIWQKWNTTSDERFLKYLTCSQDSTILCNFLKITAMKQIRSNENKQSNKLANAFLLVVAKNAERDAMHFCFFEIFENFALSSNGRNDLIATLIVIITHVHRENHMAEILKFAKRIFLKEEFKSIKNKIRKRRSEFGRLIVNYGYYFSL